jgi:hypothetical protein
MVRPGRIGDRHAALFLLPVAVHDVIYAHSSLVVPVIPSVTAFFAWRRRHDASNASPHWCSQRTMDRAYHRHPERFVKGPPRIPVLPTEVWINRAEGQTAVIRTPH